MTERIIKYLIYQNKVWIRFRISCSGRKLLWWSLIALYFFPKKLKNIVVNDNFQEFFQQMIRIYSFKLIFLNFCVLYSWSRTPQYDLD